VLTCNDNGTNGSGHQSACAEDEDLRRKVTKSNQVRNEGHVISPV